MNKVRRMSEAVLVAVMLATVLSSAVFAQNASPATPAAVPASSQAAPVTVPVAQAAKPATPSAGAPPAPATLAPATPGIATAVRGLSTPVNAPPPGPADGYNITTNPIIADALGTTGQAFYLGAFKGDDGWLLVRDNEIQTVYMPPDRKAMFFGVYYGAAGYNVTGEAVRDLIKRNPVVASQMTDMMRREAGVPEEQTVGANGLPALPTFQTIGRNGDGFTIKQQNDALAAQQAKADAQLANETPEQKKEDDRLIQNSIPPGERLISDLQTATGLDVGDPSAPLLFMIMDPNCPHCQATWRLLRDAVFRKTVRIHLIPIGRNEEDERAATRLLLASDPLNAWDKYVAGDKTQLAGPVDPKLLTGLRGNHALVDSWSISETPYTVYRSKSGEVKVLAGEPDHADKLLDDVGP